MNRTSGRKEADAMDASRNKSATRNERALIAHRWYKNRSPNRSGIVGLLVRVIILALEEGKTPSSFFAYSMQDLGSRI